MADYIVTLIPQQFAKAQVNDYVKEHFVKEKVTGDIGPWEAANIAIRRNRFEPTDYGSRKNKTFQLPVVWEIVK